MWTRQKAGGLQEDVARSGAADRLDQVVFFTSRALSQAGQALFLVVLVITSGSGSSVAFGLSSVMAATMAGPLLFGLLAGSLADRLGPARAYLLGTLGRLAVITAGFLVLGRFELAWAVALAYSSVSQLYSPAEMAMVPLVERRSPARTHALLVVLQYVAQGLAVLLLAPVLLLTAGAAALLALAVTIYLAVLVLALVLNVRVRPREPEYRAPSRQAFSFRRTASFLTGDHRATYAFGSLAFVDVVAKCVIVALPAYLLAIAGPGRAGFIAVAIPAAVGAVLGMLWAGTQFRLPEAQRVMRATLLGAIVSLFALAGLESGLGLAGIVLQAANVTTSGVGFDADLALVLPVALLFGASISIAPIAARAVLSATAPHGQQARVFASQSTLSEILGIVPLLLAGLGTEVAGPQPTLGLVAVAGLGLLLVLEGNSTALAPHQAAPAPAESAAS